jgi:deoxyribonuclease V
MQPPFTHRWDVTPAQARLIQEAGRALVVAEDRLDPIGRVAGVDVGFEQGGTVARAAVAVLEFPSLAPVASAVARRPAAFPYVPGLLSFREIPAILDALERLDAPPDLLVCDGQGLAHPRRFGLACHLGVLTGLPSLGAAKSRLLGEHGPLPPERGAWAPLVDRGETVGAVLRTRAGVAPLYVSIGHRVSLARAVGLVLALAPRYRLPETTRRAHRLASGPADATAC